MNIMIDYDKTYTSDISMWREVMDLMQFYGHKIYLVTSRFPTTPIPLARDFTDRNIPIIYCSFKAKRPHCESLGIDIQIWIDDDPQWITEDIIFDPNRGKDSSETDLTILSLTYGVQNIQNGPRDSDAIRDLFGEATEQGC